MVLNPQWVWVASMQPWLPPRVGVANARAVKAVGYHPACTEWNEGRLGIRLLPFIKDPCGARGEAPEFYC
ncbi:MAG: hypothetical protein DYH13_01115 [Alphaproteobacteria bacterium PRO2]|nr:hypothetical protein [Alphaproteobacteria bacterium PRO2]